MSFDAVYIDEAGSYTNDTALDQEIRQRSNEPDYKDNLNKLIN